MLKLASWNINSLKVRLDQVLQWLESSQVDILALQETKITDDQFPKEVFTEKGYYAVFNGQKTYNGVALISKHPIEEVACEVPGFQDPQKRTLAATIAGIRVINLYVPNGGTVGSDKYVYKLNWLNQITAFVAQQLAQYPLLAVVGDFNVAPTDIDVHDPSRWQGQVLVSPLEREAFLQLLNLGLIDSFRHFNQDLQAFSWWDYRAVAFRRNMGLRIDHILLSHELNKRCIASQIDKEPRRAERPSDHTPVWVSLASAGKAYA